MAKDARPRRWFFTRLYDRLLPVFTATIDPASTMRVRLVNILVALAVVGAFGLMLLLLYSVILIPLTPSIADLQKAKIAQPSVLMSADGRQLATLKPMNREWVKLNQISPHVISALIATEDHRFL